MRGGVKRMVRMAACSAVFLAASAPFLRAESRAVIVAGLAADGSDRETVQNLAQQTRQALLRGGFASVAVVGAPDKARRDAVLAALAAARSLKPDDQFWLVLFGHSAKGDDGPVFQLAGPRLSGADLKAALDAIPARQFVFVGTEQSGGYVPPLLAATRTVLAATRGEGEVNSPRFPEAWAASLQEGPGDDFARIAARAAEKVDAFYAQNHLAKGEHARMNLTATGQVVEAPFGTDAAAKPEAKPAPSGPAPLIPASEIEVAVHDPNAEWETQPPTAENRKLVADAAKAPNPDGYAAVMLEKRLAYSVDPDRTTERAYFHRVYLAREEGVAAWANYLLPQAPPSVTTKLEVARVVQPDGSSTVFNPAKLPAATDCSSGLCGALTVVYLPRVRAGCVVEIGYRTRELLDATLPEFSTEIPLQEAAPVLKTSLLVRVPEKQPFQVRLNNLDPKEAPATSSSQNGWKATSWTLGPLEPVSALPYDPPQREFAVWLGVSSFASWDAFAAWYRRLAQGSDAIDDSVRKKAKELAAAAPDRTGRIKAAYDFVSALRYVAVEIGVQGFRPRTPATVLANRYGDCKDKANLLAALLASMGIEAHPALVNRGSYTDVTFPSWQFNHAVCLVPKAPGQGQADDLWLDSTDGVTPFGFPAPGDMGRAALVLYPDSARFQTVSLAGAASGSGNAEEWEFRDDGAGGWSGTVAFTPAGLVDYGRRAALRGATPRQRRNAAAEVLAESLPGADFAAIGWGNPDDLDAPMVLKAEVALARGGARPVPGAGHWTGIFAEAERGRPMLLNDGQPLRVRQVARYRFAEPPAGAPPAPFAAQAGGESLSVAWTARDPRTWEREAVLDLRQPRIAAADYPAVRRAVLQWAAALQSAPF